MAKIIVVTSGKGGVGKTTTSAAIGTGLALRGHKTAIVDFDVGLRTLAWRTGDATLIRAASRLDLPVLPPSGARERKVEPGSRAPAKPAEPLYRPSRVITSPIRGGQQVYAQGGDLIVLAPVSPGAELLADGNIHVYGPLRGRALAGIKGDTKARIFCRQLAAEMVSIAGQYKVAEDLRRDPAWAEAVQVSLSGDVLNITRL